MSQDPLYIGVDLGRSTRIALVDSYGKIVSNNRFPTELSSGRGLVNSLIEVIKQTRQTTTAEISAIGIGFPGLVDHRTQKVEVLPNLADVSNVDIHQELCSAIDLPVILDNDANTAAYGEWKCGAAKGTSDVVFITIGTGIGGGIILGGYLQRGVCGFAGEFGHLKVGDLNMDCSCGSSGCLETVSSGPNIVRRTRERLFTDPAFTDSKLAPKMRGRLRCEDVMEAAILGDYLARSVLSETAIYLGTAISNLINLLNVEKVVLGGPVMKAAEYFISKVKEETSRKCFAQLFDACEIVAAKLGDDAGVIGSAMMAQDSLFNNSLAAKP
ncbi:MAG: ROK family protein [Blastocatellia bacterium]|nr:ROK family protein [Blastocatellia bacterium]